MGKLRSAVFDLYIQYIPVLVFTNGKFLFLIVWITYSLRVQWRKSSDWKHLQFNVFFVHVFIVYFYNSLKICFFNVFICK